MNIATYFINIVFSLESTVYRATVIRYNKITIEPKNYLIQASCTKIKSVLDLKLGLAGKILPLKISMTKWEPSVSFQSVKACAKNQLLWNRA